MKKTIIAALLMIVTSFAFSQNKTDSIKKPVKQFQPDLKKTITITVTLPLYQVDNFLYALQNPNYANSDMQGKVINVITANSQAAQKSIVDSVSNAYSREILLQQKEFDSADKKAPDKKKKP